MSQYLNSNNLLLIIIFLLLITSIVVIIFKTFKGRARRFYKSKGPFLLSVGEKRFFDALQNSIGLDMYICPKVRIADIVEVNIPKYDKEFWPKFNKISQKHIDFLICNRADFAPRLIIELDGGSHDEKARSLRDALVNNVFKDAEIPILHINPSNFYEYKSLRELISQAIKINKN